jgi:hypothetical protein
MLEPSKGKRAKPPSPPPESDDRDVASHALWGAVEVARVVLEKFVRVAQQASLEVPGNPDDRQILTAIQAHRIELARKDVIESLLDLDDAVARCFGNPFIILGSLRDRIHEARTSASQAISAITIEYPKPNRFDRSALEAQMRERLSSGKRTHRTPPPGALHGAAQLALLNGAAKSLAGCVEAVTPLTLLDAPAGPESVVTKGSAVDVPNPSAPVSTETATDVSGGDSPHKGKAKQKEPAWQRLVIVRSDTGDDLAQLDGEAHRLTGANDATFLELLKSKEGGPILGNTLERSCEERPARIYSRLPKAIQRIIDKPGRRTGKKGYRML